MMSRLLRKKRTGRKRAQTLVEFAMVLPILMMIIYGLLEVGRLIFVYSTVVSASREAVRYGSATGLNVAGGIPRYQDCDGIRAAAQNVDFLNSFNDADITISFDTGPGTAVYKTCPAVPTDAEIRASPSTRIKVQVSALFSPLTAIVPLKPITITSWNERTILIAELAP